MLEVGTHRVFRWWFDSISSKHGTSDQVTQHTHSISQRFGPNNAIESDCSAPTACACSCCKFHTATAPHSIRFRKRERERQRWRQRGDIKFLHMECTSTTAVSHLPHPITQWLLLAILDRRRKKRNYVQIRSVLRAVFAQREREKNLPE